MQNNINNNEQDAFNDIFRQKLENHQLPVDAECWNEIEARLNSKKRRIIPFWFWLTTGGTAVAFLALLFTLRLPSASTDFARDSKQIKTKQINVQNKIAGKQASHSISTKKSAETNHKNYQTSKNNKVEDVVIKEPNLTETATKENIKIENNGANEQQLAQVTDNREAPATTNSVSARDSAKNNSDNVFQDRLLAKNAESEKPAKKPKKKQDLLLAAAFSTGGGMNFSGNNGLVFDNPIGKSYLTNGMTDYSNILSQQDFSEKNYMAPVSFGIIVRKQLNKAIGIESGLVYTYLLSTFSNSGMQHPDAKLHLHYVGVPINFVGLLWDNPTWEIYLSGGGMVEKGIQSVYSQNQYSGNRIITTIAKTNINGLQWSVNGAIGVTYKVQRNWGIYFEPKLSYFFDNNQPASARTEDPVVIGISAGVRFRIK
ncbi:hypothetical protein Palpr_1735 [Paludibacter propionicigenes WB4]|uniref:Outer membrane protein beta-barrel domain-containing protein n=1 Tax=Paludibacter propionicigenes (strain DSM 17365 / JCM 13257 / WB4) TaxID=694427 RepID=E4T580_PALPW|nr:outer membrane beta-barrel protein [Paludibacter propionicigenes]ADQ79874.1 hypothetical protein Palpr_1735 [Paludibacter propionicigenes WB4]